jgi:hypothetical protein
MMFVYEEAVRDATALLSAAGLDDVQFTGDTEQFNGETWLPFRTESMDQPTVVVDSEGKVRLEPWTYLIYPEQSSVETKAVRRVRTPEGSRHYGQPIGSVILRDVIPHVPWMQRGSLLARRVAKRREQRRARVLPWSSDPKDYRGLHQADGRSYGTSMDNPEEVMPDLLEHPEYYRIYGEPMVNAECMAAIRKAVKGGPDTKITIYRAVPKGVDKINPGDWVTPSKSYAKWHGESDLWPNEYDIIQKTVRAGDIWTSGDSLAEWGWAPQTDEYQPQPDTVIFGGIKMPAAKVTSVPEKDGVTAQWVEIPEEDRPPGFPPDLSAYLVQFGVPSRNRFGEVHMPVGAAPNEVESVIREMQANYAESLPPLEHRDKAPVEETFDRSYLETRESERGIAEAKIRGMEHMVLVGGSRVQDPNSRNHVVEASAYTIGIVNAVMAHYKKKYGHISGLIGRVRVSDEKVIGKDGQTSNDYMAFERDQAFESPFFSNKTSEIVLNAKGFPARGKSKARADKRVREQIDANPYTTWTAVDIPALAKLLDIPEEDAFRLNVVHHETGHAISNLVLGSNQRWMQDLPIQTQIVVMASQQALYKAVEFVAEVDEDGNNSINQITSARYVSNYGATNLHEHLAEVWAAYNLQRDINGYVQYVGTILDETFKLIASALPDDPVDDDPETTQRGVQKMLAELSDEVK